MTRARDLSRLANANALTVDANNNVGVGSTIPTAKLNVVGVVSATSFFGSGTNLTGVISGIQIRSAGTSVGTGITNINFVGATATATGSATTITIAASFNELDAALFS
jgi:hypothetical protein